MGVIMETISYGFTIVGSLLFSIKFMLDLYNEVSDIQEGINIDRNNSDYLYGLSIVLIIIGIFIYILT